MSQQHTTFSIMTDCTFKESSFDKRNRISTMFIALFQYLCQKYRTNSIEELSLMSVEHKSLPENHSRMTSITHLNLLVKHSIEYSLLFFGVLLTICQNIKLELAQLTNHSIIIIDIRCTYNKEEEKKKQTNLSYTLNIGQKTRKK